MGVKGLIPGFHAVASTLLLFVISVCRVVMQCQYRVNVMVYCRNGVF